VPLQFPVEPDVKRRPVFLRIGTDHAIWHGTPYRLMNGRSVELLSPDGYPMIILTKPDWLGRQCHKPRNSFPSPRGCAAWQTGTCRMTGFGSVRWSDAMNQLILIALPTLPVLVTGAGEEARISSSNFSAHIPTRTRGEPVSFIGEPGNVHRYNIDPDKLAAFESMLTHGFANQQI